MDDVHTLRSALARERAARAAAEDLLERKSEELFETNRSLEAARLVLERRVAEVDAELQRSLRRFELALAASSAGALECRLRDLTVEGDHVLARLLGVAEIPAKQPLESWLLTVHPEDREATREAITGAVSDEEFECDLRVASVPRMLHLRGRLVEDLAHGEAVVFALARDVTRRRRQQSDQRRLATDQRRRERLAVLGELASSIAHEVNQPLGAMCNYAAAARRILETKGIADENLDKALTGVVDLAHEASDAVRSLRALLTGPGIGLTESRLDLAVQAGVRNAEAEARDAGVTLTADLTPMTIPCSAGLIEHTVANLVRNAIEAIEMTGRGGSVTVGLSRAGDHAVITVDDTGPGLGGMDAVEIFEPLVTSKPTGSGMGLPLCRTVAEQHSGSVRCTANPSHETGLRVELRLPTEGA